MQEMKQMLLIRVRLKLNRMLDYDSVTSYVLSLEVRAQNRSIWHSLLNSVIITRIRTRKSIKLMAYVLAK